MASKHPACHTTRIPRRSPSSESTPPEVAQRLREAFPEIWARYEWLLAARAITRRTRKG